MKRTLTIFAALLLLASVCSCQNDSGNGDNVGGTGTGNAGGTDGEYVMPDVDMGGEDVTVLNIDDYYSMYLEFAVEEGGDTLDAAIYDSNMRVQEELNFTLVEEEHPVLEWNTTYVEMGNHLIRNIQSGSDVYDFVHFPINSRTELVTSEYIMDLSELDGLQLDKPWWDTQLNESINVNGRQYMACGAINLMPYEAMTTIFFNKEILTNNGLDNPYDMVRDGTWTMDALLELARDAQTMNSDATWEVFDGGTSVFGIAMHRYYPMHFIIGAGVQPITENNGKYTFALESDTFYTALDKVTQIFTSAKNGGIAGGTDAAGSDNYITLFSNNRALFLMSELKAGVEMRDSEVEFGILPAPKLSEEQESYYTDEVNALHFICIPAASENPEDVAKVIDALAYDRYKNVVPVYYDSYVAYKGLRDEDSYEMLEIMSASRTMDVAVAYGWYTGIGESFTTSICNAICWGDPVASLIAERQGAINTTIEDFVDNYLS